MEPLAAAQGSSLHQREHKRLQMADIARLAGVSKATVSRALNHSTLVSEDTRERILALASSLNYSINIGAQNLRLGQNRTVGVVVPYDALARQELSDPFFLSLLGSLADALTARGYDLLLSRVDAEQLDGAAMPFDTGRVAGIILVGEWRRHEQLDLLAERGVPMVVWGAQVPGQRYLSVGGDNASGGMLATGHLLAAGRRRIAFIGDITQAEVAQRYRGYCQALDAQGVAPDAQLCVPASFQAQDGAHAVHELARRGTAYDGIFACSDLLAMTAINALRTLGREVPREVAVVGYDDIALASYFHPPLSTIRQPVRAAGEALVASLMAQIEGRPAASLQLPAELVVRG